MKYKYKHDDCIYVPLLEKFKVTVQFFHIGRYIKGKYIHTTAIQKLDGSKKGIRRYINSLRRYKQILEVEELSPNVIISSAKHKKGLLHYKSIYNPILIHPTPSYLSKEGFEVHELASWQKKPLQDHIRALETDETTEFFEIIKFVKKKLEDVYLLKLLPKLAPKQEFAIKLAFREGFYEFPRMISLTELAKLAKVSKPTFRENLKKAERKLMPELISK